MNDANDQPGYDEHRPYHSDALLNAWLSSYRDRTGDSQILRLDALGIADARMGLIPNATMILHYDQDRITVRFAGPTHQLPAEFARADLPQLTLHDQLILPGLVNAHAHLDLTHIGPQPHEPGDGFVKWVDMIRNNRASDDAEITRCVRLGIEKSLAGGVIAVGDIAGAPAGRLCDAPAQALAECPLIGVSFLEFFGIGITAASTAQRVSAYLAARAAQIRPLLESRGITLGLQPHAPNTVDLGVYRWVTQAAQSLGMPLCTHLAETIEERQFIRDGSGPQRDMLERFGVWDDSILHHVARGMHPVEHLKPVLQMAPYLVAHVNDASDAMIDQLAQTRTSVAYCPRASRYFGAEAQFGPHRYRDMLDAGINVCLGTDSIVNLDTPDRISTLDDLRLLSRTNHDDPSRLLAMCTTNAALALGLDPNRFTIGIDSSPIGLIGLRVEDPQPDDLWGCVMSQTNAPHWLFLE